jgi:prevent-host-death family protein
MTIMANAITTSAFHAAVGHFLDHAQREPVVVAKHGRPYAVVISATMWQRLGMEAPAAPAPVVPAPRADGPGEALEAPGASREALAATEAGGSNAAGPEEALEAAAGLVAPPVAAWEARLGAELRARLAAMRRVNARLGL